MTALDQLQRTQLDRKLRLLRESGMRIVPQGGWTKTVRNALGMSGKALGGRIGVSQSAISQLEASEERETITLGSLRKLAEGMECDLVYAFVPKDSLDEIMRRQATLRARNIVNSVATSMELEDQAVSDEDQESQVETLSSELLFRPDTGFWNEV